MLVALSALAVVQIFRRALRIKLATEDTEDTVLRGGELESAAVLSLHCGSADEADACCGHGQLQPIGRADLVEHAREMVLDRLFAHREALRNFFVCAACDNEREHFALAGGEAEWLIARRAGPLVREASNDVQEVVDERLSNRRLPGHDAGHRFEEQLRGAVFQNDAS